MFTLKKEDENRIYKRAVVVNDAHGLPNYMSKRRHMVKLWRV